MTVATGLKLLLEAFAELRIPVAIGGSVASSARGMPRFTADIDLVASMAGSRAEAFVTQLGPDWYADAETIQDAIRRGRSFNVIYIPQSYKFDIFPAATEFHHTQLERATLVPLTLEGSTVSCPVTSAEDILLAKLSWLQQGGGSERQRHDIEGIINANRGLDRVYLESWARRLGIAELLKTFLQ
ncbi:MAG: hypothetical protein NTV70_21035 [Acidobacteria bacterium]|nr:hypothetical protein [Acidobacteriota bacterium]